MLPIKILDRDFSRNNLCAEFCKLRSRSVWSLSPVHTNKHFIPIHKRGYCSLCSLSSLVGLLAPNRVRRVTVFFQMNERESEIELAVGVECSVEEKPWNCKVRHAQLLGAHSVLCCDHRHYVTQGPAQHNSLTVYHIQRCLCICMEVDSVYFNVQPMILKSEEDRDYSELILFSVQLFVLSLTTT